jgi:hypothetical protein
MTLSPHLTVILCSIKTPLPYNEPGHISVLVTIPEFGTAGMLVVPESGEVAVEPVGTFITDRLKVVDIEPVP